MKSKSGVFLMEGGVYAILTRVWPRFRGKLHRDRTRVKGVGSNCCNRRDIHSDSCLSSATPQITNCPGYE